MLVWLSSKSVPFHVCEAKYCVNPLIGLSCRSAVWLAAFRLRPLVQEGGMVGPLHGAIAMVLVAPLVVRVDPSCDPML